MRIAVTGSSGFIGQALVASLTAGGHEVRRMVRRTPTGTEIGWRPDRALIDVEALAGVDAVVHLAGESIAAGRWTKGQRRRILESRTQGTRLLAGALAGLRDGPRVLVSASAIGYYGDRGSEVLDEASQPGDDFLAEVCQQWESATAPAVDAGLRVVNMRTGVVQSTSGGALARQLPLFRAGVGGRLGSGRQWVSWVSLNDLVGLYEHALTTAELAGPVNATAPDPVPNAEYTETLGRVLGRPTLLPIPKLGPKLVFGEMAEALLFVSQRVQPRRATDTGYRFRHPTLEECLRDVLDRPRVSA